MPSIPSPVVNVPLGTVNDGSTSLPLCDYASLHQTAGNSIDPNKTITALGGNNIVNNFIYMGKGNENDSDWDSFKKNSKNLFPYHNPPLSDSINYNSVNPSDVIGKCSMSPIDLSTMPDDCNDNVIHTNDKRTKSFLSMKPPGMSNVQWCWSAKNKLSRTPSPDNANDIILEEVMVQHKLDLAGLLQYRQKQAHHVEKFTPSEKLKLADYRKKYDDRRANLRRELSSCRRDLLHPHFNADIDVTIDTPKEHGTSIIDTLNESDSDSEQPIEVCRAEINTPNVMTAGFQPIQLLSSSSEDESNSNTESNIVPYSRVILASECSMHTPTFYHTKS